MLKGLGDIERLHQAFEGPRAEVAAQTRSVERPLSEDVPPRKDTEQLGEILWNRPNIFFVAGAENVWPSANKLPLLPR